MYITYRILHRKCTRDYAACKESSVDFAIGQVKFLEEFKLPKKFEINRLIKTFLGLVEMMFGLVNVGFSLPEWQAVEMIFCAPCYGI